MHQASCTVVLGVPNVPPLSPPQLLNGSQLLVGGERWAQPNPGPNPDPGPNLDPNRNPGSIEVYRRVS